MKIMKHLLREEALEDNEYQDLKNDMEEKWTFYLAIRLNGVVHDPLISTENANDENFLDYVRNTLVPHLQKEEVVICDRFGTAGRCKNPKKQHYNPEAKTLM
ncbi:hypothetical protein HDU92_007126 [Lobulomyces angularis]|nr:hypothetical protein HDU92_007126 [Lobulomyces angularis]